MNISPRDEFDWIRTTRSVERRQRFLGMPKKASRWVNQIVSRRGIAETQSANELESTWREVAGPTLAERTRVGSIRRGVCEITVENSSLLQQVIFQQSDLLRQMQTQKPHFGIQSFRFRVGPIR